MITLRGAGAALLTVVVAAACSSSSTGPSGGPSGGHSTTITAVGSSNNGGYGSGSQYYYTPTPDTLASGSQVTFAFQDVAHTVVFDGGPGGVADIGATSNANVQRTFATAGTYTWHCSIHPYMHGTLVAQ
jgi:plastocyanin